MTGGGQRGVSTASTSPPPAAGATPSSYGTLHGVRPQGLPNCFQTAQTGGGRVETRQKGLGFEWGDCVCLTPRSPGREADVDPPKRVCNRGISDPASSSARTPPSLPPRSCAGEGKPRFGTTVAFTFLGGYNPRLDGEDSSFLFFFFFPFCFYFWRGAPSNCLEHMPLPPSTSDRESPFLHLSFSFPLSLLKVRGVAAANQRSASIL